MRTYCIVLACLFLFACKGKQIADDAAEVRQTTDFSDSDTIIVWNCDAENETRSRIFQSDDSIQNILPIINGINSTYPEMQLRFNAVSKDTVLVELVEGKLLVNQMGSSGAEQYLSFAAMNLLEAKGIRFVKFSLPEGAHAKTSVWNTSDFTDWKIIAE
ncbi:MAG: hypothetical protein FJX94_00385 [Bacteroidetes bacterium]|nr:hypothetical protein [Bacteroidota bacterium]